MNNTNGFPGFNYSFPKRQILDSSNLKEFADDNFNFDENGRKFSKPVENTVGKGEIARYEQFLLFPVFSKDLYCKHVKTRACLGKDQRLADFFFQGNIAASTYGYKWSLYWHIATITVIFNRTLFPCSRC